MDTNDLYYSEGSHLIDNGNSNWMENTVLVGNENISWQEDGPEITVDYSEIAIDHSLVENEDYLTADTGDSDEASQYFSILESNCDNSEIINNNFSTPNVNTDCVVNVQIVKEETIIPDITKSEIVDDDEFNTNKNSDNQLVLYRMDGSDDLYAVQIADDGKGNIQKYQYKVRQSANGEFEPIPGSVEIQNSEIDDEQSTSEETVSHEPDFASHFIKEEPNYVDNSENILTNETNDNQSYFISNEKAFENISPEHVLQHCYDENADYENVSIMQHELDENGSTSKQSSKNIVTTGFINNTNIFPPGDDSESEYEIEALDEDFQDEDVLDEEQTSNSEHIFQHQSDTVNLQISNIEHENDLEQQEHLPSNRNVTIFKDDQHLSVLVVNATEKENVVSHQSTNFNSLNLRSILKSNCTVTKVNETVSTTNHHQPSSPSVTVTNDDGGKSVNACGGDLLQINTTAIKSIRQPRKQIITPIERVGSEIIVQPLVYSLDVNPANGGGFRSTSYTAAVKRKRVTDDEILQISDDESDPEFTLKSFKKKNKSKRGRYPRKNTKQKEKLIEITIIESDDESVIEVLTDHESNTNHKVDKSSTSSSSEGILEDDCNSEIMEPIAISDNEYTNENNLITSDKTLKTNGNVESLEKIEHEKNSESGFSRTYKCPMCSKTFPRQITLRKHLMIHHSTRRNLRSRNSLRRKVTNDEPSKVVNLLSEKETAVNNKMKQDSEVNTKKIQYRCVKCKINFLTEGQYKRHQTVHTMKRNSTGPTQITSIKQQQTSSEKSIKQVIFSSPNRSSRSSTRTHNEVEKSRKCTTVTNAAVKEKLKCEYCGQMFSERTLFTFHRNSHKTFPCPNCKTTFTAKLLLDDHLRKNCLKSPVKKPRLTTRRSFMKCDVCHLSFATTRQLQNHISVVHKTKKPISKPETNKTNINQLIVKKRAAHGGVPMSMKMQKALDKIKYKT